MHISEEPTPATPFTTVPFSGNVLVLGSGSLGQGVLPLLQAHLRPGDLLLNLAVDVSSIALIAWCQDAGVVYIDADLGAWPGAQIDPRRSVAERDSQAAARRRAANEFVNTWSVQALHDQACQPSELGWGTHERHFPAEGARHAGEPASGIYLMRPGADVRVRSWTPAGGPMHGYLLAQPEALSIADHLTIGDPQKPQYRPTVLCAYRPSDDAMLSLQELAEHDGRLPPRCDQLCDEILTGMVELGVLLVGHARGAYWYGSRLAIDQAREACPYNNATTLQAAAGVVDAAGRPAAPVHGRHRCRRPLAVQEPAGGVNTMPWTEERFPPAMLHLPGWVRAKAIEIANALLASGMEEGRAIRIAIASAKRWATPTARPHA